MLASRSAARQENRALELGRASQRSERAAQRSAALRVCAHCALVSTVRLLPQAQSLWPRNFKSYRLASGLLLLDKSLYISPLGRARFSVDFKIRMRRLMARYSSFSAKADGEAAVVADACVRIDCVKQFSTTALD